MTPSCRVVVSAALAALVLCLAIPHVPTRAAQDQPATAPKLDSKLLEFVRDDLYFKTGKNPEEIGKIALKEWEAFHQAVQFAARTPLKAFDASAVEYLALTYPQLLAEPIEHRGKVITVQGILRG